MRVTSLLRRLLQFRRVSVDRVHEEHGTIVVSISVRGRSRCSQCGRKCSRYDRLPSRRWRHLDVGAWEIELAASLWRVDCHHCGVTVEQVSFAEPNSGFTRPFEDLVGWLAQRCDKTMISEFLRIAWRTVGAILERVIARHRQAIDFSTLRAISVDELSWRKGHHYLTLVTDLERSRVIAVMEGRSAESLAAFFREIGPENCARIRHVSIDMSAAWEKAIGEFLPNAELCYDRFHVLRLLSDAVDEVRREEWRRTQGTEEGESTKHTRYAVLKRPWNVTPRQQETLSALPRTNRRLYRAYLLKEAFAGIYDRLLLPLWARRRMKEWLSWAKRSQLRAFRRVARTIQQHLEGILAFFNTGYTTGMSEGQNTKARLATRQAYGFHTAEAVRAMIELRCSRLNIPLPRMP